VSGSTLSEELDVVVFPSLQEYTTTKKMKSKFFIAVGLFFKGTA
jgi:hypothetical protein